MKLRKLLSNTLLTILMLPVIYISIVLLIGYGP